MTIILSQAARILATTQEVLQNQDRQPNSSEQLEVKNSELSEPLPKVEPDESRANQMSTKSRFSGGEGTVSNPYQIANIDNFEAIRDQLPNGGTAGIYYLLTENITLIGNWTPNGGYNEARFQGNFDGGGKTFSGLSISSVVYQWPYEFG